MFKFLFKKNDRKTPEINNCCPYCGVLLEKPPSRKAKCKDCKEYIYVRSNQILFPSALLTESDAKAVDLFRALKEFDVPEEAFHEKRRELSKRFGSQASARDTIWGLFNDQIAKSIGDFHRQKMLYYQMALFINEEGRDPARLIEQSNQIELQSYKSTGIVEKVGIIAGDHSCSACQKNAEKTFTIQDAMQTNPIPCKECTHILEPGKHPFCRCCYSASSYIR